MQIIFSIITDNMNTQTDYRKEILFMEMKIKDILQKDINEASYSELYTALLKLVKSMSAERERGMSKKKLYYISAEFLIGKMLSNNLINLGIYDEIKKILADNGKDISEIENIEPEPSLGNGGLGRLAACFLDSIATLGLNGDGVGINYHYGLFRQKFKDHLQTEQPDPWMPANTNESWLIKTNTVYNINFKDISVKARMYDIAVTGYNSRTNRLHLFDCESADDSIIKDGINFDKDNIKKNLTLFLYPDDSDKKGKLLRLYQQYFMVSAAAQLILDECEGRGCRLYDLYDYAVIQINDTHPTMIIPELIRLLCEKGIDENRSIEIVMRTCAYTNHTILAEALEKWPLEYFSETVPQLIPIIKKLDKEVRKKYTDKSVYIIDEDNIVHMANIDIHYGFSINGVAALHTNILKNSELNNFYKIYPEKFNNKTNGITFRRWLLYANPLLSELISSLIGDKYKTNAAELEKLNSFTEDDEVLEKLLAVKQANKHRLQGYMYKTQNININESYIFDIQIKRLHEYKRQQMNALYLIRKYLDIKSGIIPKNPITAIFGAKAAPAYTSAQDIIHLILCLGGLINNDTDVNKYINVFMVENYNVTKAQMLIPACDISEQISLASKEASGTGNMKLMLNGAVTLGTQDGANAEIHDLVGDKNIYIFGASSDDVINSYNNETYISSEYYENDKKIKESVDYITSPELLKIGSREHLTRLKNELINKDYFMTFYDFHSYINVKDKMISDYSDRKEWAKKMLINISKAGYFSSDRTIEEYNRDIWKL